MNQIWLFYIAYSLILFPLFRSKLNTYDDVVERVAQHLGLDDPSKIRLTSHNCYSQQPKPQPIKYRGVDHLSDMLVHYNQVFCSPSMLVKFTYSFLPSLPRPSPGGYLCPDFPKCLFFFFLGRLPIFSTMKYWISLSRNCKVWRP